MITEIKFNPPIFVSQMEPVGFLIPDPACQACWYYYMCADKCKKVVGRGPESQIIEYDTEGPMNDIPLWMDKRYAAIAKSIAMMYGLKSPDDMFKYWPKVTLEAARLGMPNPEIEYMNPPIEDRIT